MRLAPKNLVAAFSLFILLSCLGLAGCADKQGSKLVSDPAKVAPAEQPQADDTVAQSPAAIQQEKVEGLEDDSPVNDANAEYTDFEDDFDKEYQSSAQSIADPLEPLNRFWFTFNDYVFSYVWRPVSIGYNAVVPKPVRTGVSNFFYNLKFPLRFVNDLLQGKFLAAGVEFSRFVGNTAFGLGGVFDVTSHQKAAAVTHPEDFGQTLGYWGFGHGIYIVWPLFGPSTLRDSVGMAGDYFCDPITYIDPWFLPYSHPELEWVTWSAWGLRTLSITAATADSYFELRDSAFEPYTAFRNAYVQHRNDEARQ